MTVSNAGYRHNHYVPIWYQRRFMLPDQDRYFRLSEAKSHFPAVAQAVGFGLGRSKMLYLSVGVD